jgi:hypothetical protein
MAAVVKKSLIAARTGLKRDGVRRTVQLFTQIIDLLSSLKATHSLLVAIFTCQSPTF